MGWILLAGLVIAGLMVSFVLLTDGRYFGKRLMYWVYDRLGPVIFSAHSEASRWQALVRSLEWRGDERILDVGTAVGDLPLSIASLPDFHGRVVGVDWSSAMVAKARQQALQRGLEGRSHFEVVDVRQGLPFEDGGFDIVFCLGLLETLPEQEQVLAELRRVLRADGSLVLSLYQGWASKSVALSLEWYQEHLGALGLGAIKVVPCRGNHDAVVARAGGRS